jgi:hypothetical protein
MALLANPLVILGLLLALSSGGNWILYKLWQGRVAEVGAVAAERDQAIAAGQTCTAATARLEAAAAEREAKLQAAIKAAAKRAKAAAVRADKTLTTPPKFKTEAAAIASGVVLAPGTCASALDLSRGKLAERHRQLRP